MSQSDMGAVDLFLTDRFERDLVSPGNHPAGKFFFGDLPVRAYQYMEQKLAVGTGKDPNRLCLIYPFSYEKLGFSERKMLALNE